MMTGRSLVAHGRARAPGNLGSPVQDLPTPRNRYGKRLFDVVFAAIILLALLPIFAVIIVAIKLDSPGPVFYRVRRVGFRGQTLMMLKFRKMHEDAAGPPLTGEKDPRLTRVGRFLTAARLDELPQFWDVLRGRMSIVGPRPEDPGFVALAQGEYAVIHTVRPGITGLSQLAYAEERSIVDDDSPITDYISRIMPQKLKLDQLYATTHSLKLDFSIIRWTVATVLFGVPVAVSRATGRMTRRRRPARVPATHETRLTGSLVAPRESDGSPLPHPPGPSSRA